MKTIIALFICLCLFSSQGFTQMTKEIDAIPTKAVLQKQFDEINESLYAFAKGNLDHFTMDDDKLALHYKNGTYDEANINDIDNVVLDKSGTINHIYINCKDKTTGCVYSSHYKKKYTRFDVFSFHTPDATQLYNKLNKFIDDTKLFLSADYYSKYINIINTKIIDVNTKGEALQNILKKNNETLFGLSSEYKDSMILNFGNNKSLHFNLLAIDTVAYNLDKKAIYISCKEQKKCIYNTATKVFSNTYYFENSKEVNNNWSGNLNSIFSDMKEYWYNLEQLNNLDPRILNYAKKLEQENAENEKKKQNQSTIKQNIDLEDEGDYFGF